MANLTNTASLINNKVLNLGRAAHGRNVHEYSPVTVVSLPVNDPSLVAQSYLVKLVSGLDLLCADYVLPPLFAEALPREATQEGRVLPAVYSSKRAVNLPTSIVINLKLLGLTTEDVFQEFTADVKGAGIKLKHAEHVTEEEVIAFLTRHGVIAQDTNLAEQLVFSRNEYMDFKTPEGAQEKGKSEEANRLYRHFARLGHKLVPQIASITLPQLVQALAREFDKPNKTLDILLSQQVRLMPSYVRASYLESNGDRNPEIVRLVNSNEKALGGLTGLLIDDAVRYFVALASATKQEEKRGIFRTDYLGDIIRVLDDPTLMFDKDYGWFLVKDIVIANTGLYFADTEECWPEHKASTSESLHYQHTVYLTALFKDFYRMLANYCIAVEATEDPARKKQIEQEVRDRLIARLNQTGIVRVEQQDSHLDVAVNYTNIPQRRYKIEKRFLPSVT